MAIEFIVFYFNSFHLASVCSSCKDTYEMRRINGSIEYNIVI